MSRTYVAVAIVANKMHHTSRAGGLTRAAQFQRVILMRFQIIFSSLSVIASLNFSKAL
jgi:hypothetical protein